VTRTHDKHEVCQVSNDDDYVCEVFSKLTNSHFTNRPRQGAGIKNTVEMGSCRAYLGRGNKTERRGWDA